jgi:hypothetical protein
MAHLTGQSIASTADAGDITDGSSAGGPTVEDSLDSLDTEKAPLASPTFTGTPAAPTAAVGTSTTQLATTAFAMNAVGLVVPVAADGAAAILNTTKVLYLASTTTGTKPITQTSTRPHQCLEIVLAAGSGGEYNLPEAAGITGGDLTFIDSGDRAWLYRNAANDAWFVVLDGATIVP